MTATAKETPSIAMTMTRAAREFDALVEEIRSKFYDLPAPDTDGLTWSHVGTALHAVDCLHAVNEALTK